ncbi:MAG: hypothetical protein DSY66_04650 [Persephonella sp.]|nr:MAG: hypothetical protein DSY53_04740 [Persephonella sp.]RUM60245.1 MAG: hypothetical protein DSY66_04650 [Persephonella sp.]
MEKKSFLRFLGKKEKDFLFLEGEELHHSKVRRVKLGELIEVNTLDGNIYIGKVIDINKKYLKAELIEKLEVYEKNTQLDLYLIVPNKLSKIDDLIEPLSELGVDRLNLVIGKFTAVKEKDILKKMDKWRKKALNSLKQCKRLYPLEISGISKLSDIEANSSFNILFYEKEKEKSLKDFIGKTFKSISIVIGNEAGFDKEEVNTLKEKGFITLSLAKNILRMETALITAVSQSLLFLED